MFNIYNLHLPEFFRSMLEESGVNYSLLADNNSDLEIHLIPIVAGNRNIQIPISVYHTTSINHLAQKKWKLESIQGLHWAGTILFRKIIGANFMFIGTRIIATNNDTLLESDVRL